VKVRVSWFLVPIFLFVLVGQASAAVYWTNPTTIGRVNLDGTHLEPEFIARNGTREIVSACGVAVDRSHIYWADAANNTIGRANLDGTAPNYAFITGANDPCGVAVNDSHIFWANREIDTIGRANLDGTEQNQSFLAGDACGIAVNDSHLFWGSLINDSIVRASLDGTVVETDFIDELGEIGPCGVAVNGAQVFWGSYSSTIGRANLDGSNPSVLVTDLERPCAVAADDSHFYWIEQSASGVGRANLNGTAVNRGFVSGSLGRNCGVAVDSLSFSPPPPPPPVQSTCKLYGVNHIRRNGSAFIRVYGPAHGSFVVGTKGLSWRVITKEPPARVGGLRQWVLKIWPGGKGRAGNRIRERLNRSGRASVKLRVRCHGLDESPTTLVKRISLRRAQRSK